MGYTSSIGKHGREVFPKCKKITSTTILLHVNSNESNNFNTSNSDNDKVMSNFPHSNIKNVSSLNTLINLQKVIYKESSVSIYDEIIDQNYIS